MGLLDDDDIAVTFVGSMHLDEDYRCVSCGYGVSSAARAGACPMCRCGTWRPFRRVVERAAQCDEATERAHVVH